MPELSFRGLSGTIASGRIATGSPVTLLPSQHTSRIKGIHTHDGELATATAGQAVTLVLADDIDMARGDMLVTNDCLPTATDRFTAMLVWMAQTPLQLQQRYALKIGTATVFATVHAVNHHYDIDTGENDQTKQTVALNDITVTEIQTDTPVVFDTYANNPKTGGFIMIDVLTNHTVAAGMIQQPSAHNTVAAADCSQPQQSQSHGKTSGTQQFFHIAEPCTLWFTGLSGAGKTTIANLLAEKLRALGQSVYVLDGDNVRQGLNADLGFSDADWAEGNRRLANVAQLMTDAGLIVIVAAISPLAASRKEARQTIGEAQFIEVFIDTPLAVAESRDVKGLYKKARAGEIKNFTGIDSPYEPPEHAEIVIDTTKLSAEAASIRIFDYLAMRSAER